MDAKTLAIRLVDQMTLEEMAGQLLFNAPSIPRLGISAYNWWNEGLHGAARSGTATVFPQAIGLAATFDTDLLARVGDVVSTEQRAKYHAFSKLGDFGIYKGLSIWSPNINIFRDPRWGRGQETYGEDPFLTGTLAVAFITGLQGTDSEHLKTAACVKHFAAHSGPEASRHHTDNKVSPKDLEETYLPAFRMAVQTGHVASVMGAYTGLNGEPTCASSLIETKLRKEWGFTGFFISDCWAIRDFHEGLHVTRNAKESASFAIHRGCDLNCGCTYAALLDAYHSHMVSKKDIRQACIRLFTARYRLGILPGSTSPWNDITYDAVDSDQHARLSLQAARESFVLLENKDGFLPFPATIRTIAVIGPEADSRRVLIGNYHGTPSREVTYLEGVRHAFPSCRVLYSEGSALTKDRVERLGEKNDRLSEAKTVAAMSDVVVLCLGLDESVEGEMHDDGNGGVAGDKKDLLLPACQRDLLDAVDVVGKPIVLVLSSGGALDPQLSRHSHVRSLLQAWYPGQAGGTALAEILQGAVNPSGRLPVTFYKEDAILPPFEDYAMQGRTYRYVKDEDVLYPFGYGLSYTEFLVSGLQMKDTDDQHVLALDVRNTGARDGSTVVFVTAESPDPDAPDHPFLAAWKRVTLAAGEEERVSLSVDKERLSVVRKDGTRTKGNGHWVLHAGLSVRPDASTISVVL